METGAPGDRVGFELRSALWAPGHHTAVPHLDLLVWPHRKGNGMGTGGLGFWCLAALFLRESDTSDILSLHISPYQVEGNTTCPIHTPQGVRISPGISAKEHGKLWSALSTRAEGIVLIINQRIQRGEIVKLLIVFGSNTIKKQSLLDSSTQSTVYL